MLTPNNVAPALWLARSAALKKWHFRPYIHQGKPDRFYADITFPRGKLTGCRGTNLSSFDEGKYAHNPLFIGMKR